MALEIKNQVYIDRGNSTQCTISLFGGTLTSWVVHGVEQLFVSKKTVFNQLKAIRGGVRFIFPKYNFWPLGPDDGFAKMVLWDIYKDPFKLPTGDIQIILQLTPGQLSNSMWNYKFDMRYTITLLEREIEFNIKIINLSSCFFYFQFVFSNHLRVPNTFNCHVQGLKNSKYIDHLKDVYTEDQIEDEIQTDQEYFTTYVQTADSLKVTNIMAERDLFLSKTNLPDVTVHTITEEQGKTRVNFCPDEWNRVLILDVGHTYRNVELQPEEQFEAHMKMKVKSTKEKEDVVIVSY